MKTMKAATLHPVIDEKLKYCIPMESGIEDGCRHLIFKQENGLCSFMMITKQLK